MKKYLVLFGIILLLFNCKKENQDPADKITGCWNVYEIAIDKGNHDTLCKNNLKVNIAKLSASQIKIYFLNRPKSHPAYLFDDVTMTIASDNSSIAYTGSTWDGKIVNGNKITTEYLCSGGTVGIQVYQTLTR